MFLVQNILDENDMTGDCETDIADEQRLTQQLDTILKTLEGISDTWDVFNCAQKKQLAYIARAIGAKIERDLYSDSLKVTKECENLANNDINKDEWLNERNSVLIGFLKGCTSMSDTQNPTEKKKNSLIHTVEQVLNTRNLTTVSPFSFQRNLVQYSITGSKVATNLLGSWEPAGSYTKVQTYINAPSDPPKIPDSDVHLAVDNEQRVGRSTGRIREGSSIRLDICTTMSCLQPHENKNLQQKDELKPAVWRKRDADDLKAAIADVEGEEEKAMKTFRQYRQNLVAEIINDVNSEIDGNMKDHIDTAVLQKEKGLDNYVCCKCRFVSTNTDPCPKCKYDPNQHPSDHDIYHRTPSQHPKHPPRVIIAEPCMVNPNTKVNVQTVLEHVREQSNTSGEKKAREWTYVWCDAVPYLLGSKVQDETLKCALCEEMVKKTDMKQHQTQNHQDQETEYETWFDDIFLRPGPGHIELNMARALMKLLWDPFLQHFTILLGFRSPRAQEIIHNGVDHHRSRQIISTLLNAFSKELIRPFVLEQRRKGEDADVNKYFEWLRGEVKDPNYIFAWRVCFTFLLAFQLYTESVRKNNHEHMLAARSAFAPLFYGRNHPRYRELHLRDMLDRVQCPDELKEDIKQYESFSVSGVVNKGQGADFVHEEVNRTVKALLLPGAVTASIWTKVCRKADTLSEMKAKCLSSAGVNSISGMKAPKKHDHEETMFRRELRDARLLDSPRETNTMTSIIGVELDHDLPNMLDVLTACYRQYKEDVKTSGKFGSKKISKTLYITKTERARGEMIEAKSKEEIKDEITKMVNESGLKQVEISLKKLKASTVKADYLKVYYEAVEAAEEEAALRMLEEEEEGQQKN